MMIILIIQPNDGVVCGVVFQEEEIIFFEIFFSCVFLKITLYLSISSKSSDSVLEAID